MLVIALAGGIAVDDDPQGGRGRGKGQGQEQQQDQRGRQAAGEGGAHGASGRRWRETDSLFETSD